MAGCFHFKQPCSLRDLGSHLVENSSKEPFRITPSSLVAPIADCYCSCLSYPEEHSDQDNWV